MSNTLSLHPASERPLHRNARLLGALDPNSEVYVTFLIRQKAGSAPLPDMAYWRRTPPSRRKFPTPEEFVRLYGSDETDLDAVASFATASGLTMVERHAGRSRIVVKGLAGDWNRVLNIQLNQYGSPRPWTSRTGRKEAMVVSHRGFKGKVSLPEELIAVVKGVIGLDNRNLGHPGGTGDPSGASFFSVPDMAGQYNFPNPSEGVSDMTVAIFADAGDTSKACFLTQDITNYINSLPSGRNVQPTINQIDLKVGCTTFSNQTDLITHSTTMNPIPDGAREITCDISIVAAVAQGVNINVYFTEFTEAGIEAFLNRVIVPEAGDGTPSVLTSSWLTIDEEGLSGSLDTISDLYAKATARGVTCFSAAGDWGSNDQVGGKDCHVGYPSSEPWSTVCGGTIASTQGGTLTEWVWSDAGTTSSFGGQSISPKSTTFGATGGGVSTHFGIPDYQSAAGLAPTSQNSGDGTGRGVPDVAGMVGYIGFQLNGSGTDFIGTSAVAPLYAGLMAVLNHTLGVFNGFLNPTLYAYGNAVCNDVTTGNNDSNLTPDAPFYTAGTGWDACTGWGSIDGAKLLQALKQRQFIRYLVGKNTFGFDEVSENPTYRNAFYLEYDGFSYNEVVNAPAGATTNTGPFHDFNGVSISVNATQWIPEQTINLNTPQRILQAFDVVFTSTGSFPGQGGTATTPIDLTLNAQFTPSGDPGNSGVTAEMLFTLTGGSDPFFANVGIIPGTTEVNEPYLSQDLLVFTATPGVSPVPVSGIGTAPRLSPSAVNALDAGAAYAYLSDPNQGLLAYLNENYSDPTGPDPFFPGFPLSSIFPSEGGALTVDSVVSPISTVPSFPFSLEPFTNYNFAIARVRLNGEGAKLLQA